MNNYDLSIIIPVYNAALLINRCLDSIFNQNTSYSFEVILVDDGSSDNSIELINRRVENNLILIKQVNSGPAKARNVGLKQSSGKYCAYLDADDYWEQGFIEKSITFLENNAQCVAVNVAQLHKTISGKFIIPSNYKQFSSPFVLDDFYSFWASYMHVCTGSVTIRTLLLKELGGQREELRITEDLELWALLATKGKWGFIPEQLFVSDGCDRISNRDWIKRMKKRWYNAPSIENWESRIIKNMFIKLPTGYLQARGKISRNLTYCQLLSNRLALSRREALRYGKYFTKDTIGRLMNMAKYTPLTWWFLAKFLKYREYHRK